MKVLIVTTSQPSINPRMRKAADAFAAAGHHVLVLYSFCTRWASESDRQIFEQKRWDVEQIGGDPELQWWTYHLTRAFRRIDEAFIGSAASMCRAYPAFFRKGIGWKPDIVIGHNPGTLSLLSAFKAALGVPVFFDAEDFHRGEVHRDSKHARRIQEMEDKAIPQLTAMTAASPLIAQEYSQLYPEVPVLNIHNTFPKALQQKEPTTRFDASGRLRLVWFSQVVGLDRGLEEFLKGMAIAKEVPISLSIVGTCSEEVQSILQGLVSSPAHEVRFYPLMPEQELFRFIHNQDIGLASELPTVRNRDLCLTNKVFAYTLCGCSLLLSRTSSQVDFFKRHPQIGHLIDLEHPLEIAKVLTQVSSHPDNLVEQRRAAWTLGNEIYNWDFEGPKLVKWVENWTTQLRNRR